MESLVQDLRYGIRILIKSPGFTLTAVLILSFGIGANIAVFSLINALFFRPLPVHEPQNLVGIYQRFEGTPVPFGFSYPDFVDLRKRNTTLTDLTAISFFPGWFSEGETPVELQGQIVSGNYFSVLGLSPYMGRFFLPVEDSAPGKSPVAVISYDFWRSRFNSDPKIIGKTFRMNRLTFTVVGIAPNGFTGIHFDFDANLWIPLAMAEMVTGDENRLDRMMPVLDIVGRLKPGKSIQHAGSEFNLLVKQLTDEHPDTTLAPKVSAAPLRAVQPEMTSIYFRTPRLLLAAAGCLLLIVCANLAGLLLVRGTSRRNELAVRLALGAGRGRLIRQLLIESLLLSTLGLGGAFIVAVWAKDWVTSFILNWVSVYLDYRVIAFAFAVALFTGLFFGLPPSLYVTRTNFLSILKQERSTALIRSRLRSTLIIAQIGLSLVLLTGAVLLIRSMTNALARSGYDSSNIAHFEVSPGRAGYDKLRSSLYNRELLSRIQSLPNVQSAGFMSSHNVRSNFVKVKVKVPGNSTAGKGGFVQIPVNEVTPGYMKLLRIPVLEGREFEAGDRDGSALVAIVNKTLARRFWNGVSPIGKKLIIEKKEHEIVGIVPDFLLSANQSEPLLYLSFWQRPIRTSHLLVRTTSNAETMIVSLRREIIAVDPDVHISRELTLTDWTLKSIGGVRVLGAALSFAGMIALFLSAIGLYGLLAFLVNIRKREIGIRIALGAQQQDILLMVGSHGLKLTLIGIAAGLLGGFASTRILNAYLFGVQPADTISFVAAAFLFVAVATLACYLPARRAAKVDPAVALREE